jgi:fructose-1-phosphate kinase PfkB-like protein
LRSFVHAILDFHDAPLKAFYTSSPNITVPNRIELHVKFPWNKNGLNFR